ncbi:hypothetical protein Bca4012_026488 [Brassica carinata]
MSSSSNFQKNCDAETSKAAGEHSSDQTAVEAYLAHIAEFLSFQSELARSEAEEMANPTCDASLRPAFLTVVPTLGVPAEGVIVADTSVPEAETYVSCIVFDLISSRFKVRDMYSVYMTCMVGIEHLFGDNFKSLPKVLTKILDFFYSAITLLSGVRELSLEVA